jgi:hypothetical protein
MKINKNSGSGFSILLLLSYLFIIGCDDTFEPLQENDQYHFSIYGYLDVSADTQWVRVMPVREDIFIEPKPIDAVVTLEHMESGESVVMNDSLFSFPQGYAWNFWTTTALQSSQTYRLTAVSSSGSTSYAMISLPDDFETPLVHIRFVGQERTPTLTSIYIQGVERLADIRTVFYGPMSESGETNMTDISHLKDSTRSGSGRWQVYINPLEDFQYITNFIPFKPPVLLTEYLTPVSPYKPKIYIASAGPGYHFFPSIDEKIVALPDGVSNIINGVGYVAGIISKTVPYKNCITEGTTDIEPCPLEPPPW